MGELALRIMRGEETLILVDKNGVVRQLAPSPRLKLDAASWLMKHGGFPKTGEEASAAAGGRRSPLASDRHHLDDENTSPAATPLRPRSR